MKQVFVARFEDAILSGRLTIGQKLPSERELASQLGVSRPIVHEGLVDLAHKGLVSMLPRVGSIVNDYRKEGSLALLTSLLNFRQEQLEPKLLDGLLELRKLIEVEIGRLAALHRSKEHLSCLEQALASELEVDVHDKYTLADRDFAFHHALAMATDNPIFPLLLNSFKPVYTSLSVRFFSDPEVMREVLRLHGEIVAAVREEDADRSRDCMQHLIEHGEQHLRKSMAG